FPLGDEPTRSTAGTYRARFGRTVFGPWAGLEQAPLLISEGRRSSPDGKASGEHRGPNSEHSRLRTPGSDRGPRDGVDRSDRMTFPLVDDLRREPVRTVEPVRTAVLGLGYWGPNLVRNPQAVPDAE